MAIGIITFSIMSITLTLNTNSTIIAMIILKSVSHFIVTLSVVELSVIMLNGTPRFENHKLMRITLYLETSGTNVIKLFTTVIYHHSTVIPSFCVLKLYYLGNYCVMGVNYRGILTLEKVGFELLR
jgi:hypothetical protein